MRRLNLLGVPKLAMKILVSPLFFSEIRLVVPYNVSLINVIECMHSSDAHYQVHRSYAPFCASISGFDLCLHRVRTRPSLRVHEGEREIWRQG